MRLFYSCFDKYNLDILVLLIFFFLTDANMVINTQGAGIFLKDFFFKVPVFISSKVNIDRYDPYKKSSWRF
mgnify:CR=1 FL=1